MQQEEKQKLEAGPEAGPDPEDEDVSKWWNLLSFSEKHESLHWSLLGVDNVRALLFHSNPLALTPSPPPLLLIFLHSSSSSLTTPGLSQ